MRSKERKKRDWYRVFWWINYFTIPIIYLLLTLYFN